MAKADPTGIVDLEPGCLPVPAVSGLDRPGTLLDTVLDAVPDCVAIKDCNGVYLEINQAMAAAMGRTKAAVIGKRDTEIYPTEDARLLADYDARVIANGGVERFLVRLSTPGGQMRDFETIKAPWRDAAGGVVGVIAVARDVTDLRAAETKLRQAQRIGRIGHFEQDLTTGEMTWSDSLFEIWGRSPAAFQPTLHNVLATVHADDRERVAEAVRVSAPVVEYRIRKPDGAVRHLITEGSVQNDADGRPALFFGVTQDVTARRELESRIAHVSKLSLLGELAAGLAHEISQPLYVIRLMAEGGLDHLDQGDSDIDRVRRQFSAIIEQADRINTIISYVRRFGRRDTETSTPFDPVASIRSAIMMTNHQIERAGICLRTLLPDSGSTVMGHPGRFEQVIINLLTNAIDAIVGSEGRSIFGSMGTISVGLDEDKAAGTVTVRLEDDGPGIPAHVRERMFDPFFTTKAAGKGTGLGLSICLGIVAEMGGRLEVAAVERGACIDIVLPVVPAATEPASASPPPLQQQPAVAARGQARGRGRHVLVVDDDETCCRMIAGFLRRRGFRITTARNGAQAMARFLDDGADAVITDITMTGGDGNQLIRALRSRTAQIPIIVVTGRDPDNEPDAVYVREATDIQRKPARLPALLARLTQHLGSGEAEDEDGAE
ncbi:MAG: PAS domain-containing protein [Azospirillum sp.]|nr:PAS domain-containing protein [Azospirillum sp.]